MVESRPGQSVGPERWEARWYGDPPFWEASCGELVAERFVIRPDELGYEPVDDEMLVIDFATSDYYLLNDSGAAVWRALTEPRTADEVADAFAGVAPDARAAIRDDVDGFLAALAADGLVVRTADDAESADAPVPALTAPYVVPRFEKYGTLERLMLAGE
jgi:hypothetical protein